MVRASLVRVGLIGLLLTALCFAANFDIYIDSTARGTSSLNPSGVVLSVGDSVTWHWNNNTIIHELASESLVGPRCLGNTMRPNWWPLSPVYRGNNSAYTWTQTFPEPGTWNYLCTSTPPLSGLFHCTGKDMRGVIVVRYPTLNAVYDVVVDPIGKTFTPSSVTIKQGDIIRWSWIRAPITALSNIITEGSAPCVPYNSSRANSSSAYWTFAESPVFYNNGLWTPEWFVKFDTAGTFPYFSANAGDFTACKAGFRGVINVLPCTPNVDCQPSPTLYPTPVPIGQDPVDPSRRVQGVDNWVLWTAVAYLSVLGVLLIATIIACVIGSKKSEGQMIAICLMLSEQPDWARIKI